MLGRVVEDPNLIVMFTNLGRYGPALKYTKSPSVQSTVCTILPNLGN